MLNCLIVLVCVMSCVCVCDSSDPKVYFLFDAFIDLMIYYDKAGAFSFLGLTFCAEFSRPQ